MISWRQLLRCKNQKPAAFQAARPHAPCTRRGRHQVGVGQQVQVRGGRLATTCPPGLQLQLHQASIGRVQASLSSS